MQKKYLRFNTLGYLNNIFIIVRVQERSFKKYVSVKNDHKTLSVNINKIKTQIKPVESNI